MGLLYWSQSMVGSLLMRAHLVLFTLAFLVVSPAIILAQEDSQESAQCTFEDGKQMVARYNKLAVGKNDQPPTGKPWAPGGKAMTLFTEAEVTLSGKSIPTGGYTMWTIPGKRLVAHRKQEHICGFGVRRRSGHRARSNGRGHAAGWREGVQSLFRTFRSESVRAECCVW